MSLTDQEIKMLDAAAAQVPEEKPKPKRKPKQANEPQEVENDVELALAQGEADDIESRLPTHNEEGKKMSPRERRIAYLNQITHNQIRGISKLSVAKLDAKIQEIEASMLEAELEPLEGEEDLALEEAEPPAQEEAPTFSIEEIKDGAKFCAQLAAQGLLGVEKLTRSTCSSTGIDCSGAYVIYNSNPMFQQHAEKGWEKLLSENPRLVQKILGPWFYLGNAYATPCALAAANNLREARIKAMKE